MVFQQLEHTLNILNGDFERKGLTGINELAVININFMKKLLCIFTFLFSHFLNYGQNVEVYYDVDTVIFNKQIGYNYLSDSIDAKITCIILPLSYEKALPGFQHQSNNKMVLVGNGEIKGKDKRISYKKGKLPDINSEIIIETYLIEVDIDKTIVLSGTYDANDSNIILNKIEVAARSIRIK